MSIEFLDLEGGARLKIEPPVQEFEGTVSYSDFCVVKVLPGQVFTVLANSPCATGAQAPVAPGDTALIGGIALGAGVGVAILASKKSASP